MLISFINFSPRKYLLISRFVYGLINVCNNLPGKFLHRLTHRPAVSFGRLFIKRFFPAVFFLEKNSFDRFPLLYILNRYIETENSLVTAFIRPQKKFFYASLQKISCLLYTSPSPRDRG